MMMIIIIIKIIMEANHLCSLHTAAAAEPTATSGILRIHPSIHPHAAITTHATGRLKEVRVKAQPI